MLILIKSQVIVQGHASSLFLIIEMQDLQKPLPISRPFSADYILYWHLICLHATTNLIIASLYMYIFYFFYFCIRGHLCFSKLLDVLFCICFQETSL